MFNAEEENELNGLWALCARGRRGGGVIDKEWIMTGKGHLSFYTVRLFSLLIQQQVRIL